MKLSKVKDTGNLRSNKRKLTCYIQGNPLKDISGFFSRNLAGQKGVLKEKKCQTRILYPAKLSLELKKR